MEVDRILRLVGLGVRGRTAIVGAEQVRQAAKAGKLVLAIVAADASANTRDKLIPLLNARRISFIELPSAAQLGAAVGRDSTAAIGVVDPALANGIKAMTAGSGRAAEEGV